MDGDHHGFEKSICGRSYVDGCHTEENDVSGDHLEGIVPCQHYVFRLFRNFVLIIDDRIQFHVESVTYGMIARKNRIVDYLTGQLIRENKIKPIVTNDRKGPSLKIRVRQPVGYSGTCFQQIGRASCRERV